MILGTAGYMSPEQAKGFEADHRSDIFSFGCVLYELLTGRQAFEGDTASEILASVLKTEPDFAALPARLNPRLMELLKRCLEKNPKKRWHSAADVRVEIESVMGRALAADEPGLAAAALPIPLWKRAVPIVITALVVGPAAGYFAWMAKQEPARDVTRFVLTLPLDDLFTSSSRQMLTVSPGGGDLVYVANRRLFHRALSTLETREIAGSELDSAIQNVVFSPDGQTLAFYSTGDSTLRTIPLSGGLQMTICSISSPYGMSWGEGGILFGQSDKGIMRVSPEGGVPALLAPVDASEIASNPQMLPGGQAIVFSVKKSLDNWDRGQVVLQSVGGERRTLIERGADARYLPTGHLAYAVSGVLFAIPFDLRTLTVQGEPVPVVEGVRRTGLAAGGIGTAQFSNSLTGSLAYIPGPRDASASDRDLVLFDRKGTLQPLRLPPAPYRSPRASRDGQWVTFDSEDETDAIVWVYHLGGASSIRRLTFGGKNRSPIWSADGQWIAFQSDREGDLAIFRQRADGPGTAERLTKAETGAVHTPEAWSPDGAHLLYSVKTDKGFTLWTQSIKEPRAAQIPGVQSEGQTEAVFSPDGKWIAFRTGSAVQGGPRNVFVQPFPSTGAQYQVPHVGGAPYWTSKNELILNVAPGRSLVIPVSTSPRLEFGQPSELPRAGRNEGPTGISRRNADAKPDGEHFVGVTDSGAVIATVGQIVVVLNWFDEIRARVTSR